MVLRGRDSEWMTVKLNQAPPAAADSAEVYAASQTQYAMPVTEVDAAQKQKQSGRRKPVQSVAGEKSQAEFGGRDAS